MKRTTNLLMLIGMMFLGSCIADDEGGDTPDFPPLDRGNIQVNRIILTFTSPARPNDVRSFEYYDEDGFNNGNPPSVNETITLDAASSGGFLPYESEIRLYNNTQEVTNDINNLGNKYIICYGDWARETLRLKGRNLDGNGVVLGTESTWETTDDAGGGIIKVTLNYLPATKEGLCDAGFRIFEGILNYQNN